MTKVITRSYESLAEFMPDWVAVPGGTILDLLEERAWTQADFALRTGFSNKHINLLIKGDAPITEDTALKLERVLGSSAQFWLNLETQYRAHLARQKALLLLNEHTNWLAELPLADMVKFGWVTKAKDKAQQVYEALRYFGVDSVDAWRVRYERPAAAYRASGKLTRSPAAVSAWLRFGEKTAETLQLADYDRSTFEAHLKEARALSRESDPAIFLPKLTSLCAQAGVVLVIAPAPKGCPVSGATKWLANKALILLSLCGKSDDQFWFSFFHEAGHLLKHGKKMTFLDILGDDGLNASEELEANTFARDLLIPPAGYQGFVKRQSFDEKTLCDFAEQILISPGIVLGRLQHEKLVPWKSSLNCLKIRYRWAHEQRLTALQKTC